MKLRSGKISQITKTRKRIVSSSESKSEKFKRQTNSEEEKRVFGPENNPEISIFSSQESLNNSVIENHRQENTARVKKMSDFIRRPDVLDTKSGNLAENWRRFKRNFDIYLDATELSGKAEPIKIGVFLNIIGQDAVEVFDTFGLSDAQKASYVAVIKAFSDFCTPKKNTVYERFMFYQRKQKEGESFDSFLMEIKMLVRNCEFGDQESVMLRDQIVMGVIDKGLQIKLLGQANLTYETAVDKSKACEAAKEQAETMNSSKAESISEVRNSSSSSNNDAQTKARGQRQLIQHQPSRESDKRRTTNTHTQRQYRATNQSSKTDVVDCKFCGLSHKRRECPAYGKTCNSCSKPNHFASVCRHKNVDLIQTNDFDDCSDYTDNEELFINTIENVTSTDETDDALRYPWVEKLRVEETNIDFKIDSGAQTDVLPLNEFRRLKGKIELRKTTVTLLAFGGQRIKPIGMCSLQCVFNNVALRRKFVVVDLDITPILGLFTCTKLGLFTPTKTKLEKKTNKITSKL